MSGLPDLAGRVAVVTGGASGIGRGIAERLRAEGMEVVLADIEEDALRRAAGEIGALGIPTDVGDIDSVRALARVVTHRFGTVHVVCNNAGIGPMARVADLTIDDWRWMIGVNLWGVVNGVTTFLPILLANPDGGHIVNTASMAGLEPTPRLGAYVTTKYGVVGLSETLAMELADDGSAVGVTVLCPGPVHTNIGRSSRNRPQGLGDAGLADVRLEDEPMTREGFEWVEPDQVGAIVVDAIREGRLYALTHPRATTGVEMRHRRILQAFEEARTRG